MSFLLRCVICLGLLYAAILRHDGYLVDPGRLADAATAMPRQAGDAVATGAGAEIAARVDAYCRNDAAACLSQAAALAGVVPHRRDRVSFGAAAP